MMMSHDVPHLELEDSRSRDGFVTAVDMEEENDIATVIVEEEGEELNSSYCPRLWLAGVISSGL